MILSSAQHKQCLCATAEVCSKNEQTFFEIQKFSSVYSYGILKGCVFNFWEIVKTLEEGPTKKTALMNGNNTIKNIGQGVSNRYAKYVVVPVASILRI